MVTCNIVRYLTCVCLHNRKLILLILFLSSIKPSMVTCNIFQTHLNLYLIPFRSKFTIDKNNPNKTIIRYANARNLLERRRGKAPIQTKLLAFNIFANTIYTQHQMLNRLINSAVEIPLGASCIGGDAPGRSALCFT